VSLGTKYACTEDVIRIVGDAAKKFVATNSFASWYDDVPGMADLQNVTLKYHKEDSRIIRYRQYNQGWCQGMIAVEGIKKAGKDLTRSGLITAWESLKNLDMGGIMAPVTYSPTKHQGSEYCKIYKADCVNKKFVTITDYIKAAK